jgi:hypothetical protein
MNIPTDWFDASDEVTTSLLKITLTNIFKPSRAFDLYRELINKVMSE